MSFSTKALSLAEMIEVAQRYGYEGIEPRLDAGQAHGIEVEMPAGQRLSVRDEVAAGGVELACLATSLKYSDPAKFDDMVRQTHERIDLAGDLAVPVIRVFGGTIPEGVTREQASDLLVRALSNVADQAEERNVAVCIETHDDWSDPAYIASVLQQVNHKAIGANWDIMHPVRYADVSMDDAFQLLKPWIRHLHIHDGSKAASGLLPIGEGDIDHRRALELLRTIDYDGYISGEWINWEPYEVHLPRELATMKSYETELA